MTRRTERVERLIVEEASAIILRELKDPRVGYVTVTGARVSPDLSHARVFVSVLGDAEAKERTMNGIRSAAGFIQRLLAGRVQLKVIPHLEFALDETLDRGLHIMDLLKRIEDERKEDAGEGPAGGGAAPPGA
ncbi:MAG: 30S ribosome-binding factor RbfA [bacterium]|nr:30S ribosome-binding factor RbfA [bacterium]